MASSFLYYDEKINNFILGRGSLKMSEIAIVGIGCLFPKARNPAELWDIFMAGLDVTSELTSADLGGQDPSSYFHPDLGTPDRISYTKNGYLRGFEFDPAGYQLPSEQLQHLDRLDRFCLYAAKEALKDSGYWSQNQTSLQTGLVLGNLSFATEHSSRFFSAMHLQSLEFFLKQLLECPNFAFADPMAPLSINPNPALNATSAGADFMCRSLGIGGPRFTIDAACATSLYVMEFAAYYLNTHQAKVMLAGAVCSPERLHVLHGFNVLHAFPSQGESIPFDRSSQGLKTGEGVGMFVLKRLCDAQQDGDRIHAVIENIGLSNDGAGKHILSPSQTGQYLAMERAYGSTPMADYIECHATGTPLGDQTEFNSLEQFCQTKQAVPKLGANKANIGHLLTASGMVSLIKGVWAIKQGIIPPTIGIKQGISSAQGTISAANIVQTPTPCPQTHQPKRVGINAFGFGGTNAHLILREYIPNSSPATSIADLQSIDSLAIVGMDLQIGSIEGLDAFKNVLDTHQNLQKPLPPDRWLGAEETIDERPPLGLYLEKFDLDCLRYKVPPNQVSSLLFDHLLMMKVADRALQDAGFQKGDPDCSDTAVIIAMEMNLAAHRTITRLNLPGYLRESIESLNLTLTEAQIKSLESLLKDCISPSFYLEGITGGIGNLAASRIASLWDFSGPAFTLSAQENSIPKAIEIAKFLLSWGKVKTVVIGAIDQSGGWEQVQWRKQSSGYDPDTHVVGEGAAAVVLMAAAAGNRRGQKIYASLEALSIVDRHRETSTSPVHRLVAQVALAQAGLDPQSIGYLEVSHRSIDRQHHSEIDSLQQLYGLDAHAIGSVSTNIGNTLVLSSLASLIKTALALYHRHLPHRLEAVKNVAARQFAAIHTVSQCGTCSHLILGTAHHHQVATEAIPSSSPRQLLKTLYSGTLRMGSKLLTEDNLQKFKQPAIAQTMPLTVVAASTLKIAEDNLPEFKQPAIAPTPPPMVVAPSTLKQPIVDRQVLTDARMEYLFLKERSGFCQELTEQLRSESLIKSLPIVWNEAQVREINEGKISSVLGDYYQKMDDYPIRTRTPLPPFMFVSRVTQMTATQGELKPCYIEWEYDIPVDTFFTAHGVLTGIIPFEASHVLLLALAYIGCDLMFDGQLFYRALDSEVEFLGELPSAGATIRGEVFINKFIKTSKNLILQYVYNCYHGDRQLLKITANSGYFSEADLQKSKGLSAFMPPAHESVTAEPFSPYLVCDKTSFNEGDIQALQAGDFAKCFGETHRLLHPKDRLLSSSRLLMLDRIVQLDRHGGYWKLGQILGEVDINSDHWVFDAHFKNDPVMPGTLLVEGCNQVALFYMYYLGLHTKFQQFKPTWLIDSSKSKAKFRGEVKPHHHRVKFRVTIKEINDVKDPSIVTVAEILLNDNIIGICDNLSVKLQKY
jgi:acyl transferase domain-containing protein/3-hydroxymyristoyl/3-hydroxydecanoyl-(acyl carrier protein) dehydratase